MKYVSKILTVVFGILTLVFIANFFMSMSGISDEDMSYPIVLPDTIEHFEAVYTSIGSNMIVLLLILSFALFVFFLSLTHRLSKRKKDTIDYKQIYNAPFIVYLRSFIADKKAQKGVSRISDIRTEEEVLVDMLSDIAPVYAIGDPSDKKMPLGASRIYVPDEIWKQVAQELVQNAELVVMRLGETDNFWWEVKMVLKQKPLKNILFVIPQNKNFKDVATLYRILSENNIDISDLNISVEKKEIGSISNFVYFDADRKPQNVTVSMPRFFKFLISYENILRSSLTDFLGRYGIKAPNKNKFRIKRIVVLLTLFFMVLFSIGKMVSDYYKISEQYPYELVEACQKDNAFVQKYSRDINPRILNHSLREYKRGLYFLSEEEIVFLLVTEREALMKMSSDEREHLLDKEYYWLLMIKKYAPKKYEDYIGILSKAVTMSLYDPDICAELQQYYMASEVSLPHWAQNLQARYAGKRKDINYYIIIFNHMNEEKIGEIVKTLNSRKYNF